MNPSHDSWRVSAAQVTLEVTAARRGQRAVARAAEWLKEIRFLLPIPAVQGFEGLQVEFSL